MSKSTISTFRLFEMFPDEATARVYLEGRLWPNGTTCPTCGGQNRITTRKREGFYRCNKCQLDFTIRTGTIFERSHIPLHKWIYAMYLLVTVRKGISSLPISKKIGITQKSAWLMLHRLRPVERIVHQSDGREAPDLCEVDSMKTPKVLDKMIDTALRYRPEEKVKAPRERKKKKQTLLYLLS